MNIYSFFDSPDIAAHCEKLAHEFNPLEMAVIVAISDKPMKEKHAAWRTIIAEYPDMPVPQSESFFAEKSLHEYLQKYIAREEKIMEDFYAKDDAVYTYSVRQEFPLRKTHSREWSNWDGGTFTTFSKAWAAIWDYWWKEDKVIEVSMRKRYLDTRENLIDVHLNTEGEILWLFQYGEYGSDLDDLDMIFIHIPVPFEKGDLVEYNGEVYVLQNLPHWFEFQLYNYENMVSGKCGDGGDMLFYGYYLCDRCNLHRTHRSYFYNLKFYTGKLEKHQRFLKVLSYYIKGKISDDVAFLLDSFMKFKTEADSEYADNGDILERVLNSIEGLN